LEAFAVSLNHWESHRNYKRKTNTKGDAADSSRTRNDCTHHCLPGVPDVWALQLIAEVTREYQQSTTTTPMTPTESRSSGNNGDDEPATLSWSASFRAPELPGLWKEQHGSSAGVRTKLTSAAQRAAALTQLGSTAYMDVLYGRDFEDRKELTHQNRSSGAPPPPSRPSPR